MRFLGEEEFCWDLLILFGVILIQFLPTVDLVSYYAQTELYIKYIDLN